MALTGAPVLLETAYKSIEVENGVFVKVHWIMDMGLEVPVTDIDIEYKVMMRSGFKFALRQNSQLMSYIAEGGEIYITFFSDVNRLVETSWFGALTGAFTQKTPFKFIEAATDTVEALYYEGATPITTHIVAWTLPGGMSYKMKALVEPD